jgi:hypothetical protein
MIIGLTGANRAERAAIAALIEAESPAASTAARVDITVFCGAAIEHPETLVSLYKEIFQFNNSSRRIRGVVVKDVTTQAQADALRQMGAEIWFCKGRRSDPVSSVAAAAGDRMVRRDFLAVGCAYRWPWDVALYTAIEDELRRLNVTSREGV